MTRLIVILGFIIVGLGALIQIAEDPHVIVAAGGWIVLLLESMVSTRMGRFILIFVVMIGGLPILWKVFIDRVRIHHQATYEGMGRPPDWFYDKRTFATPEVAVFLLRRQHGPLNDRMLSILSDGLLLYCTVMIAMLAILAIVPPTPLS